MSETFAGTQSGSLAPLTDWRDEITLVPYSGVQILDFGFQLDAVELKRAEFIEREIPGRGLDGPVERELKALSGDPLRDDPIKAAGTQMDDAYSVTHERALEPFLAKWVPVPVLRETGQRDVGGDIRFDNGPSNWARVRTVELPEPEPGTGITHRVQLALDTNLMAHAAGMPYLAPTREDAEGNKAFRFVSDPAKMDWFLRLPIEDEMGAMIDPQRWVTLWLEHLFLAFKTAERGRAVDPDSLPHQFEHWARYMAYLRLLSAAIRVPRMRFVNTVSVGDSVTPIPVEMVLDVGNSRTCGILAERNTRRSGETIGDAFNLEVRDLALPEHLYTGLIESRVEFAVHQMGEQSYSRMSGRGANFMWPSFVRVGPEAQRLVAGEEGTETASGLSSPKRYLWDREPMKQDWRFHNHFGDSLPSNIFAALRLMNEAGDMLSQVDQDYPITERKTKGWITRPAQRPRASRSSLFGLMLAELFAHALVQINAPASRARRLESDIPRKLERIILTLPTATTSQEQAIIKSRAEGALQLVWTMLGLEQTFSRISEIPELIVEWDEASSTQLVYLYSELARKFEGQIDAFLRLKGKPRVPPADVVARRVRGRDGGGAAAAEPSLRLACVDIGGGTTDLMITTFWGEDNRMLRPVQTFREGFRKAGDDILEQVISQAILPQLQQAIEAAGGRGAREMLAELFQDRGGLSQQVVQVRRQFALRVLIPLAVEILGASETADRQDPITVSVADTLHLERTTLDTDEDMVLDTAGAALDRALAESGRAARLPRVPSSLLAYLERPAQDIGAVSFRLADVDLRLTRETIDKIAENVLAVPLSNMAELIDHFGVDVVLLTGRPSRLPAVRAIIENMMVVPPHRLISMHRYKAGTWYPFRDPLTQRISDPKSTVAVGAMLIAMSQNRIENFTVDTAAFRMRSTARYIGVMERNGQILDETLLFRDVDLDRKPRGSDLKAELDLYSPTRIGSRQLPLERWTATPLYKLDFASNEAARAIPLTCTIERAESEVPDNEVVSASDQLAAQRAREAFMVTDVDSHGRGADRKEDVTLRLHTLGFIDDYWIDTGVFGA